ncbi:MAG: DUF4136 domain-containing protein [Pseudomonadales bacterium]
MRFIYLALILTFTVGCSGLTVNTDYAQEQDFSSYQSWQWHPDGPPQTADLNRMGSDIFDTRVKRLIDQDLAGKGLTTSDKPDFYVNYAVITDDRVSINTYNSYGGYGGGWGGYYGRGAYGGGTSHTSVNYYEEGTLIIDIIDARSNLLVWRGSAQGRLDKKTTPEKNETNTQEAILKILADFPPQPAM